MPAITPMTAVNRIFMMAPGLWATAASLGHEAGTGKSRWSPLQGPSTMGATVAPR